MANAQHAAILRRGVDAWDEWRRANRDEKPDLSGLDLRGAELEGVDLGYVDLRRANLDGANMRRAVLVYTCARGASFRGTNLQDACIVHSDLSRALLFDAVLEGANLGNTSMQGCNLQRALLVHTSMDACNLRKCDMQSAKLECAQLTNCRLAGAKLGGAQLRWVDFSRSGFQRVDLSDVSREASVGNCNFTGTDMTGAMMWGLNLSGAKFNGAVLTDAFMGGVSLIAADLTGATLTRAKLDKAHLEGVLLCGLDMREINLSGAHLHGADLSDSDLRDANLSGAQLVETIVERADLTGSHVYGVSAWNLRGSPRAQTDLLVTPPQEAAIRVDDIDVAQFIFLLTQRAKIRQVLEAITSKAVLILGRFTPARKAILDVLAAEARVSGLLPIVFDFERATSRDFTETIKVLAGLSLFVVVDLTNPKSAPLELQATVPEYRIPFVPIIARGEVPFSMFADLAGKHDWVLRTVTVYESADDIRRAFRTLLLPDALGLRDELRAKNALGIELQTVSDRMASQATPSGTPLR
jgi:uncharacterized protein YjbI with pentapeptide repeats